MASTQIIAVGFAALLAFGGIGAAASGIGPQSLSGDATEMTVENVNAHAVAENGTVTVSVTDRGEPVENVSVYADSDDEEMDGSTDANGTVTFDIDPSEELEIELEGENFEAELDYTVKDGSLILLEEEYEYERDDIEDDEEESEDDEEDEDEEEEEREDDEEEDDSDD